MTLRPGSLGSLGQVEVVPVVTPRRAELQNQSDPDSSGAARAIANEIRAVAASFGASAAMSSAVDAILRRAELVVGDAAKARALSESIATACKELADEVQLSSTTRQGLMSAADKVKLDGLSGDVRLVFFSLVTPVTVTF